ncbi:response regulator [Paenibacillus farraposensis]|uniref:Transcriptional regulatory protein n=1 Tax=Paenibacillus farraposensis TaxID=2807095 RepID=A0ABW4DL63_9BACL|nr:response regulator [Paenibacillus farraposensis]MCC3382297.1 response regulator [Paenibacillus farraposensis]
MNKPVLSDIEVLIIEDDLRIAEINRRFIEKVNGFTVCAMAANEFEAKLQLDVLRPHLVILDVYFPDTDGLSLLSFIKQHYPDTDVIMLTAAKEADTVVQAVRAGVFDFIVKPLVFERLRATLEEYARFRQQVKAWQEQPSTVEQAEIDSLLQNAGTGRIAGHGAGELWAKGIDKVTCDKVLDLLNRREELTTGTVGSELGMSRSTARRYLEYLVENGDAHHDQVYGTVGRPERIYRRQRTDE